MDILVLSPCSRSKQYDPVVTCETVDTESREDLVQRHPEAVATAAEMYTGREHQHVRNAVTKLREFANVDWHIISAGFGLLREDTEIPSYDCGFSDMESVRTRAERVGYDTTELTNDETIQVVGREKGIPQEFDQLLTHGFDLLFVILSEPYLLSVTEALRDIPEGTTAFAFASEKSRQFIGDCEWVSATETERQALGTTWMELRGIQLLQLASQTTIEQLAQIQNHRKIDPSLRT